MLSSRSPGGKYLSAKYARDREACARNRDNFTPAEQQFLEVGDTYEVKGQGDIVDDSMKIDTLPVDRNTPSRSKAVDLRLLPGRK